MLRKRKKQELELVEDSLRQLGYCEAGLCEGTRESCKCLPEFLVWKPRRGSQEDPYRKSRVKLRLTVAGHRRQ
jgi:rRNA maturation protein Nop10